MFFSRIRLKPEFYKTTRLSKILSDNAYSVHRLLWDLFPGEKLRNFLYREEIAREQLGIKAGIRGEPIYYVVSSTRPSLINPIFQIDEREYLPKLQQGDRLGFELRANPVISRTGKKHDVVMDAQVTLLKSLSAEFKLQSHLPAAPKKQEFKNILLAQGGEALDSKLTLLLNDEFAFTGKSPQTAPLRDKLDWILKATADGALQKWLILKGERHGFRLSKNFNDQYKLQNSAYRWQSIKADKGIKSGFSSVDFTGELEVADVMEFTKALFEGVGRSKAFGCGLMLVRRM